MSNGTVISYPIPIYQNVPIQSYYFLPSQFYILDITLGAQTTVTATIDMNYVIGQLVRLLIPASSGCFQLNGRKGYVISIPSANQVIIDIKSSVGVDAFTVTSSIDQPQIIAVGDVGNGYTSTTGKNIPLVTIPGSFINISPNRTT